MNPQEKQEIKKAICQALDGQPPMRIDRIATRSGVDGKALTDALFELENVGMITSTLNDGRPIYRLKSGRPTPVKKTAGKSEKEMRENVLRYFKGRPGQDVSTRSINAMLGSYQAGTSVLSKLKEEGLIERSGHGLFPPPARATAAATSITSPPAFRQPAPSCTACRAHRRCAAISPPLRHAARPASFTRSRCPTRRQRRACRVPAAPYRPATSCSSISCAAMCATILRCCRCLLPAAIPRPSPS